jgi:cellulose synthase/poly-beta-1,6-N-acetylglucosamine synthase-like glycosyltransferase
VEAFQVLEFIRSFSLGRLFFNQVNAHLIISGAFGLFKRSLMLELEGYQTHSIGEDMELVVRAHSLLRSRAEEYRIEFVADALLYTEGPLSYRDLGKQRTRWHQGLLSTLQLHRKMLLRPSYGAVGMFAYPYFFFLELLSPFVELFGWIGLPVLWAVGWLEPLQLLPFFAASIALAVLVSLQAVLLDSAMFGFFKKPGHLFKLLLCAVLEPLYYHQLMLYFRIRAFPRYYGTIHLRGGWVSPKRAQSQPDGGETPSGG